MFPHHKLVDLNYDSLTIEEKEKMLNRYKKKNFDEKEQIEIKEVINLQNLCIGAYTFFKIIVHLIKK